MIRILSVSRTMYISISHEIRQLDVYFYMKANWRKGARKSTQIEIQQHFTGMCIATEKKINLWLTWRVVCYGNFFGPGNNSKKNECKRIRYCIYHFIHFLLAYYAFGWNLYLLIQNLCFPNFCVLNSSSSYVFISFPSLSHSLSLPLFSYLFLSFFFHSGQEKWIHHQFFSPWHLFPESVPVTFSLCDVFLSMYPAPLLHNGDLNHHL